MILRLSRSLLLLLSLVAPAVVLAQTMAEDRSVRVQASVQASPASITLSWPTHTNVSGYQVFRKLKGGTSWGSALTSLAAGATSWTDNTVSVNTNYEYKVLRTTLNLGNGFGYVNAGINVDMVESRGRIVLIVDNTFTTALAAQLTQLQSDLEGDGWTVVRHDVSRTASVTSVKSLIVADYNAAPSSVRSVLLVGHVPVPYSGNLAPDGHGNHYGAWSADVYYGEVNGNWTDASVNTSGSQSDPPEHEHPRRWQVRPERDPFGRGTGGGAHRHGEPAGLQPERTDAARQLPDQAAQLEGQGIDRAAQGHRP
jgi:hypothetical protein